jgi:hypothetical protein
MLVLRVAASSGRSEIYHRVGETYCPRLNFDPDNGGSKFLRNVGSYLPVQKALHSIDILTAVRNSHLAQAFGMTNRTEIFPESSQNSNCLLPFWSSSLFQHGSQFDKLYECIRNCNLPGDGFASKGQKYKSAWQNFYSCLIINSLIFGCHFRNILSGRHRTEGISALTAYRHYKQFALRS